MYLERKKPLVRKKPLQKAVSLKSKTKKDRNASWYRKECDTIFSQIVRFPGKCEFCGTTQNLQCAHVISRTVMNLRCDPENAICLCYRCHLYGWHLEPLKYARWFEERWPGRYDRLVEKSKSTFGKKVDWRAKHEELTDLYRSVYVPTLR